MVFNVWFVIVGALLVLMALMSTVLKRLPLSSAMLYAGLGIVLGPLGFALIRVDPIQSADVLERVTELAVVISLFTAGMKLRTPFRDRRWVAPVRLATITMLVSISLATLLAHVVLGLPLGSALLLGALLAPTDPVLASDVQVEAASDRDRLRFSLTGEAGLNDGTAFPFVMLGLGLMGQHELGVSGLRWLTVDLLWSVVGGLGIGWGLGRLMGKITLHLRQNHEQAVGYEDFLALGLIALSYGTALLLHAYGFLAVFAAGLALRQLEMRETGVHQEPDELLGEAPNEQKLATDEHTAPAYMAYAMLGFSEQMERILELSVVVVLGSLLTYASWSPQTILFVVLMFVIVRPLAVYSSMIGRHIVGKHRPYMAWFGIRGIGSLYYLFYAIAHGLDRPTSERLLGITLAVVTTSLVIHGITVTPLMTRYSKKVPAPG